MRVPVYEDFQASPTVTSDVQAQYPTGPSTGMIASEQLGALGRAVQGAGSAGAQIATSMQEQVNQVRVNDGVNQLRQKAQDLAYDPATGYLNLKGDAALTRPNGLDITTEYGDKFKAHASEIAASLGNEVQRRQFQEAASGLAAQFHGQVESHMLSEFREHTMSVQDGTINLASNDAKLNWHDPDLIGPSLGAAKAAVVEKGRVSGWSAVQTDAALLATTSKVHSEVVLSALENNSPDYALAYLNARRSQMSADDILRLQGHVNATVWGNQAMRAVSTATSQSMPTIAPSGFDRMTQITTQTESGGKRYGPDGKTLLTSAASAQGEMQVMPETAKNPGYGIRPATPGDPEDLARVGREYLQAMVRQYGDPAKAWAAYNAGPGRVDQAIKDAAAGRSGSPDWLSYMPKETQAYVAKNVAQLGSNATVAPRPTELDFVNTALAQLPPGAPPQVVKLTREQAVTQFSIINRSLNEQGDNATRDAQRWLAANNGNFAGMPPSVRDPVTQYAPGKMDDLIRYSKALVKGENLTDLVLYNRLAAHPEEMARMPDSEFEGLKAHLSQADFKHFANERSNYITGKTTDGIGSINTPALNTTLNARLESLQINPTPGPKDLDGRERVGGIQKFVRTSIFSAQQALGRKFTPAEVEAHIDRLFSQDVTFRNTFMGVNTGTSSQNLMGMQVGDIPADSLQQIRDAFTKRGKANPSNTDLINAYRTWKLGQQ